MSSVAVAQHRQATDLPPGSSFPPRTDDHLVRLLVADSDEEALRPLVDSLSTSNVRTTTCRTGPEVLLTVGIVDPHVLLIGAELPLIDGPDLIRTLRLLRSTTPVLVGATEADAATAMRALAAGAWAVVARPYRPTELLQLLSQARATPAPRGETETVLEAGPVRMDTVGHQVWIGGRPVTMPLKEYQLLRYFIENAGRALSPETIRTAVWGPGSLTDTNTLSVHIRRLRKKLGDNHRAPQVLQTIRGVGYRFQPTSPDT